VRRWVWDTDMPGALVVDEMGLGKTFTSVAAAIMCKLVTKKVVKGLPLSIWWANTLEELVNVAKNIFRRMIGDEREWYRLRKYNAVPCHLSETQSTPPQGHPALTSAVEPMRMVTWPRVAEKFKTVIDEITYETDFKLIELLHAKNANLTHESLNTNIAEPGNRWNICSVFYDTLT
jgi:hypothetical protein